MKKVLFATTALVAFAGAAAAEGNITLSGSAEMGIAGGDVFVAADPIAGTPAFIGDLETQFHQDVDIKFSMEAESDAGLTFGAVVDLDEAGGLGSDYDDNGTYVYIKGSFGNLTLGDTDGALDWAVTENVGNPGSIGDNETSHWGYLGSFGDGAYDNQVLRYDNTFGQFGVAISVEMNDAGGTRDDGYAIGVKYAFDLSATTLNLGLGYQSFETAAGYNPGNLKTLPLFANSPNAGFPGGLDVDILAISVDAQFAGGFSAGIAHSQWDFSGAGVDHTGISVGYESGPFSVGANYGLFDDGIVEIDGFGLAAAYDLGGGLSAHIGYGASDTNVATEQDMDNWSLGLAMKF